MSRVILGLLAFILSASAQAHRFAPSSLQFTETDSARVEMLWKTPLQTTSNIPIRPQLPQACGVQESSEPVVEGTGFVQRWMLECDQVGLVGKAVAIDGLPENQASALVMYQYNDGRSWQTVLNTEKPSDIVPAAPTATGVLGSYIVLGAEHIWAGPDHLLFVLGLVLLVVGFRSLLVTVTSFTLGHSVTLAMVTLGVFDYPVALVEFLIALSIFMLALEINAEHKGWFARFPWAVASGFGLLHGMGFAGALSEVGLPQGQLPLALISFNIGIELGQIAFIAGILALGAGFRRIWAQGAPRATAAAIYLMGGMAAMWCIERGMEVLGV